MELTPEQVRVLGCLVEKEATTPDQYPLSTHALVTACNQKNNRDPLVAYADRDIDRMMLELRQLGLARTVQAASARVSKHKHVLDEAWGLDRNQLAILAVLMLREPSTLNELQSRTDRYVTWDGSGAVRATLRSLETRDPALAIELGRQSGQREVRFTHLLCGPVAAAHREASVPAAPAPAASPAQVSHVAAASSTDPNELAAVRAELDDLRGRFDELCRRLGEEL